MSEEILTIERSLWTNDADTYGATYLPDAILVFPEVGRILLPDALAAIRLENAEGRYWAEVEFTEVTTRPIAPEVEVLFYLARARWNDQPQPDQMICTTVYVRRDGRWRVASHQQTSI